CDEQREDQSHQRCAPEKPPFLPKQAHPFDSPGALCGESAAILKLGTGWTFDDSNGIVWWTQPSSFFLHKASLSHLQARVRQPFSRTNLRIHPGQLNLKPTLPGHSLGSVGWWWLACRQGPLPGVSDQSGTRSGLVVQ